MTLATGEVQTITYSYDALNRLETVTNPQGTTSYGYDAVGNRTSLSHANGSSQTWTYDTRNRLTSTSIYNSSGALIQSFDYTLHPTGRRTAITELNGRQSDYTYNDRYWLLTETITDSVNGNYSASYQYDKVGNRIYGTEAGISTAYTYDANDRLTQQGGVTYTYDAKGNTLEEDDQGTITSYSWNSLNQLVDHSQAGLSTQYQYNTYGIRHSQSDSLATTTYLVDANRDYAQVLAEITNSALDVSYHYGDDLISQSRGVGTHTFHTDGLGSTRVLTDVAGNESDSYGYAAFGEVLSQEGFTDTSYLYTGEQYDVGLDQYYLRARYYDQGVGRFGRMDDWMGSAQNPITLNKYTYGNVDPVNVIDPSGKFGLVSFGVASSIRSHLSGMQIDIGLSLLDTALDPGGAEQRAGGNALLLGVASMGGAASFKLLRMLSSKFRKACAANSFTGDTLVSTEDGLRPIAEIEIGDLVWAYDEETGENNLQEVIHLIRGDGYTDLVDITLNGGAVITATTSHPMYVEGEWIKASLLKLGSVLNGLDGQEYDIRGLRRHNGVQSVFNLTVDTHHTYYVGKSAVLSHNATRCIAPLRTRSGHIIYGENAQGSV